MFEIYSSGADPGFPVGGGANPRRGEGVPTYDVVKFSKKQHEIEKKLGDGGWAPPRSATAL